MRVPFIATAALLVAGSFAFAAEPGPNDRTDAGSLVPNRSISQPLLAQARLLTHRRA